MKQNTNHHTKYTDDDCRRRNSRQEEELTIAYLSGEISQAEYQERWLEIHPKDEKVTK